MSTVRILKAVEFSKLSAKFKKQYKNEQALYDAGWWLQPKYDGCYAEFHIDARPGTTTGTANTRTGEPILSCQHIIDDLITRTPKGTACVYVGELWCNKDNVRFPEISGWVRRHYAAPDLTLVCFDLLPPGLETTELYKFRFIHLQERIDMPSAAVSYAYVINRNVLDPIVAAAKLKASGKYDGAILRDPAAGYKVGLVKNGEIVKVKPVLSLDLEVVAVYTEQGEKTGRDVYSIAVVYKGVMSKVGSGMPHMRSHVPDIGQIAEIECMGLTEDGKLREPRFKGIRHDKEQAD